VSKPPPEDAKATGARKETEGGEKGQEQVEASCQIGLGLENLRLFERNEGIRHNQEACHNPPRAQPRDDVGP